MSPIDVQDILERANNAARVGDHGEAERLLKSYIAKVPESRDARLLLGTTFARQGKLTEAADEFIALLAREPGDIEALNNVAVIYRRQGKFQEALDYLKEAIDIDPVRAEFHYNIGNIHKQLGNSKAASMAYSRVIELDPAYVSAYNNLGTIYEQLKEYDKAFEVFRKGLTQDRNNPNLHFNYGVALEANGRLDDAANEYRAAMRSKPGWLAPMNNLGIILFKQGRHEKAMATFKRILTVDRLNAEALNNMGVVFADEGRAQEAVKCYRQAIEADPRYTKAVVNLERTLESSGNFADALIELEKLVKLSPDSAEIRNRLAGLYLKVERYPEALEQAESALDWEPESVPALRIKGSVQRVLGNDDEAQKSFEKILVLDPGNYSFLLDLADIHFRRKEYKEAEDRIQSYLIRRPNDRQAKMLLGKLYAEMGNNAHAIQIFEELSKADPNDAESLAAAADIHKKSGSLEKALRAADTLVNLQGMRATADDLSDLNKSLEFYENAVSAYSSSVKDMWTRNIKHKEDEEEETPDDDISMFMGASEVSQAADEEIESLFTEDSESFSSDEEEEPELILGDEQLTDFAEDPDVPAGYRDPLDALAEGQNKASVPAMDVQAEKMTMQTGPVEIQQMPIYPQYPQYPQYPGYPPPVPPDPYGSMAAPMPPVDEKNVPAQQGMSPAIPEPEPVPEALESLEEPFPEMLESLEEPFPEAAEESISEPMEPFEDFFEADPVLSMGDEEVSPMEEEVSEDIYGRPKLSEPEVHEPELLEPEMGPEAEPEPEVEPEPEALEPESEALEPEMEPEPEALEPESEGLEPEMEPEPEAEQIPDIDVDEELFPPSEFDEDEGSLDEISAIENSAEGSTAECCGTELTKIINLLDYLKILTSELPEEKLASFFDGKYSEALDSVIDSLKKLTIIKEWD